MGKILHHSETMVETKTFVGIYIGIIIPGLLSIRRYGPRFGFVRVFDAALGKRESRRTQPMEFSRDKPILVDTREDPRGG